MFYAQRFPIAMQTKNITKAQKLFETIKIVEESKYIFLKNVSGARVMNSLPQYIEILTSKSIHDSKCIFKLHQPQFALVIIHSSFKDEIIDYEVIVEALLKIVESFLINVHKKDRINTNEQVA